MGVDNYKTIKKCSVNDFIEDALKGNAIMASMPIEHYTQDELKEITKKANEKDFIVTIKAEYSNFYQGVLIGLIHKDNIKQEYKDIM